MFMLQYNSWGEKKATHFTTQHGNRQGNASHHIGDDTTKAKTNKDQQEPD